MADSSRRNENWYIVLDLEIDPPETNKNVIEKSIEEKKEFWSRQANIEADAKKAAQYKIWLENISNIEKDMKSDIKRKELAEEAYNIEYKPIDDKLDKYLHKNGKITKNEGEKIAKSLNKSVDLVKKRAEKFGIKWVAPTPKDMELHSEFYKDGPKNVNVHAYDEIESNLNLLGYDNLYDFLYGDSEATGIKPNKIRYEDLRQKASTKMEEFRKNDTKSKIGKTLCSQCKSVAFKDEESKGNYDQYLAYKKCRKILDGAREKAEDKNELWAEQVKDYIDQLTQILKNSQLSREVFVAFCKVENIYYDEQEKPGEPESGKEPSEEKKPNDSGNFGNKEPYDIDFSDFGAMPQGPIIPEESEEPGNSGNQAPLYEGYGKSSNTSGESTSIGPSQKILFVAGCVCAVLVGINILVGLLSFIPELIMDRMEKKSETVLADYNDRFEEFADGSAENLTDESAAESPAEEATAADELAADSPAEEAAPAEEAPAVAEKAGEPIENRDDFTDEEWFLTTVRVDGGYNLPHGFTREDIRWDNAAYVAAGGSYYSDPLEGQLIKNLRLWARKKEEVEGDGYWADEHLEGIHDSFDVESALNHNLLLLNNKAIVRYAREVMESSIWEELRSYVGDEEADRIDQDMYERIQSEEDIFARMPQN